MDMQNRISAVAVAALMVIGLAACSDSSDTPATQASEPTSEPASSEPSSDASGADCYVHLFDSDNFDESDDNFKLTQPGKYVDLKNLSGANTDWTDEADSIKVGATAKVTIWSETDFQGASTKLNPGTEHPAVDDEPSSLEMTCSGD